MVGALVGVGVMLFVNIVLVAYSYGKLTQKIDSIVANCQRCAKQSADAEAHYQSSVEAMRRQHQQTEESIAGLRERVAHMEPR